MIISRTPFRVSLFGGGSDYPKWYREYGGAVMGTVDAAPAVGNTTLAQTTSTVTVKSCKTKDATCPAAEILSGTVSID